MPSLPASPDSHAALLHSFFLYRTKVSPCSRRLTNSSAPLRSAVSLRLFGSLLFSSLRSLCPAPAPTRSGCRRLSRASRGVRFFFSWVDSQLSTFNCLSFPSSPHLCALCVLCGESSSFFASQCFAKSFIIRTSMTPFPQLLYNPHLRAPLGSAGNKGLINPLESALTKNSPVTPVESALTETWGWGPSRLTTNHPPPSLTFATLAPDALSMTKTYLEAAIEIAQEAGKILIEEFSRPVDIRYK